MKADIFYLLLMPLQSPLPSGKLAPAPTKKDAPYFFNLDIEFLSIGEQQLVIEDVPIQIHTQVLDKQIWLAECRYLISDIFSDAALTLKKRIRTSLKEVLRRQTGYSGVIYRRVQRCRIGGKLNKHRMNLLTIMPSNLPVGCARLINH